MGAPQRPPRPRAPRLAPDERRAALQRAASELFVAHGPGFTTADLAEAAGVSEGTIFRYFPDKSALLAAAREGALDLEALLPLLAEAATLEPLEDRLLAAAEALSGRMEQMARVVENLDVPHGQPEPELVNRLVAGIAPLFDGVEADGANSDQLATIFLGSLLANTFIARAGSTEPVELRSLVRFVVRGITAGTDTTDPGRELR